jgi:hypothetical protein
VNDNFSFAVVLRAPHRHGGAERYRPDERLAGRAFERRRIGDRLRLGCANTRARQDRRERQSSDRACREAEKLPACAGHDVSSVHDLYDLLDYGTVTARRGVAQSQHGAANPRLV